MKLLHNGSNKMVTIGSDTMHKGERCRIISIQQPREGKKQKHPRGCVWLESGKAPKVVEQAVDPEKLGMHWSLKDHETDTHDNESQPKKRSSKADKETAKS